MKKFLGFLLVLIILGVAGWAGATWYVGQETEKYLKAYIEQSNSLSDGSIEQSLKSYENTSFRTAKAVTDFKTGIPAIDDVLQDAHLVLDIQHGPVVLRNKQLALGASYADLSLDLSGLDTEMQALVMGLFGDQKPFYGNVLINFDQQMDYDLSLSPINKQDDMGIFSIAGMNTTGNVLMPDFKGLAVIGIGKTYMKTPDMELTIPAITGDMNITGRAGSQLLGNSKFEAEGIKLTPANSPQDINFNLALESINDSKDGRLMGSGSLVLKDIQEPTGTINRLQMDSDYSGFSLAGFEEVSALQAEINQLQKQLLWNMDATQNPEGQDKMMELTGQIQALNEKLFGVFFEKVLISGESQFKTDLLLSGDKGSTDLDLELQYVGANKPLAITDIMLGKTDDLLSSFALALKGKSDKSMLDSELSTVMGLLVLQGVLADDGKAFSVDASMRDASMTLNGKPMTLDELIMLFMPQEAAMMDSAEIMAIPPDIEQRIQEEGLSPEVMQILEESEDIDPVLLQQLKELSNIQQGQ